MAPKNVFKHAKKIRKSGEEWQHAIKRATKELKAKKQHGGDDPIASPTRFQKIKAAFSGCKSYCKRFETERYQQRCNDLCATRPELDSFELDSMVVSGRMPY